ncbi:MAG: DUF4491 family protein [Deltaproteobacteria bacterium]|nr:DUF4491 family protein [Deltaproteobacteria bacterium]
MNFSGLIIAIFTFFAIGLGFVWVIRLEYHVGAHVAKWVGVVGGLIVILSVFPNSFWISAFVGIVGGTVLWGATELPDQEKRVAAGQFPKKPKKSERVQ